MLARHLLCPGATLTPYAPGWLLQAETIMTTRTFVDTLGRAVQIPCATAAGIAGAQYY